MILSSPLWFLTYFVAIFGIVFCFVQGTYSDFMGGRGLHSCKPCPAGMYCSKPGLAVPEGLCQSGYYCLQGSNSASPVSLVFIWCCLLPMFHSLSTHCHTSVLSWGLRLGGVNPPKSGAEFKAGSSTSCIIREVSVLKSRSCAVAVAKRSVQNIFSLERIISRWLESRWSKDVLNLERLREMPTAEKKEAIWVTLLRFGI